LQKIVELVENEGNGAERAAKKCKKRQENLPGMAPAVEDCPGPAEWPRQGISEGRIG
jgi:hypothetical protein